MDLIATQLVKSPAYAISLPEVLATYRPIYASDLKDPAAYYWLAEENGVAIGLQGFYEAEPGPMVPDGAWEWRTRRLRPTHVGVAWLAHSWPPRRRGAGSGGHPLRHRLADGVAGESPELDGHRLPPNPFPAPSAYRRADRVGWSAAGLDWPTTTTRRDEADRWTPGAP